MLLKEHKEVLHQIFETISMPILRYRAGAKMLKEGGEDMDPEKREEVLRYLGDAWDAMSDVDKLGMKDEALHLSYS